MEEEAQKTTTRKAKAECIRRKRRRRRIKILLGMAIIIVLGVVLIWESDLDRLTFKSVLGSEEYPESLVELAKRNPEALQFVLDYPEKKDVHAPIDLSAEVVEGEFPLFLQWDERWGYETYGDDFLAVTGCGPTCLSMVYCGLTGDTQWNPYNIACMAQEQGYYVSGSGSSWSMMTELASELGLGVSEVVFDEYHIRETLEEGHPIICIMGPGDFTTAGHFIVLVGIAEDGSIVVNDPNSKINSEKTWDLETLMSQTRNLWGYSR